jgi:hypothetical protein
VADLVLFKPRRELGAQANLQAFIALCRDKLTIFGEELKFEEDTWDVTGDIDLKGKKGKLRVVFSSWATMNKASPEPMPHPFQAFAKAYFRYQHGMQPSKAVAGRISALRALCEAMQEHGMADPVVLDAGVFNRAAQLLAAHYSSETGYRMGLQLEMVAKCLDDNHLCAVPLHWKNPIPRPAETAGRVGDEFDKIRDRKLPSAYALDALARAFQAATEPPEQVITAVAALLCSAPDRVNEVLSLRVGCEVRQDRPGLPQAYGLRYWPSKGADPMVKWIVPSMADVVAEALKRLQLHSSEARQVAAWYEANPTSLFLPPHLEHLRAQRDLSMKEVLELLFVESAAAGAADWCKRNNVPTYGRGNSKRAAFVDVERAVVAMLPRGFPFLDAGTGLRYSEALCLTRRNALHGSHNTFWGAIEVVDQGNVATGLGNRSKHGFRSVFDKLGFFEADGTPLAIRTHQFRHYLNTLAQAGGMSELDIAKWSGRADIRQNSAYNHVSDRDVQARISELKGEDTESFNQLVAQTRVNLIPRAKFAELNIQAAHTTDLGFCAHDFAMSPCQLHLDCVNCNEQVCIKGDAVGEANARAKQAETTALLLEAQAADADGSYGASRWMQHQQLTLERLSQLVGILDDPHVPRGAVIRLAHVKPASRLQQAVEARKALPNQQADVPKLSWRVDEGEQSA